MSKKQLKINRFGESILSEIEVYRYSFEGVPVRAYPQIEEKADIMKIRFVWSWNNYSGYGELYFKSNSYELCNEFGENFSHMTVSSASRRQQPNGRNDCALYNDRVLAELFTNMLSALKEHLDTQG